jgi:hypothetical protein
MTTVEQERPSRAGARLERLQAALAKRREKRDALVTEVASLAAEEDAVVAAALRENPDRSAYLPSSPALKVRERRAKAEAALERLEAELRLQEAEVAPAAAEQAAEELKAATKRAASLNRSERELLKRAGEKLAELLVEWNELAKVLSERGALIGEVGIARLVEEAGFFYADATEAWKASAAFPIEPVPVAFRPFVGLLIETACERPPDEDPAVRREMNRQRIASQLSPEPEPPGPSELARLLPDLRNRAAVASVSPSHAALIRPPDEAGSAWPGGDF